MRAFLWAVLFAPCLPAQAAVYDFVVTSWSGPVQPTASIEFDGEWVPLCAGSYGLCEMNDDTGTSGTGFVQFYVSAFNHEFTLRLDVEHPIYGMVRTDGFAFYNGIIDFRSEGGGYVLGLDGGGRCNGDDWYCRGTGEWVMRSVAAAAVPAPGTLALLAAPLLLLTARTARSARAAMPTNRAARRSRT